MEPMRITITCNAAEDQREALAEALGGKASLTCIQDLSADERNEALKSADILITWNLAKELQPGEFEAIHGVRLIQLLTAGADQFPFALLPGRTMVAGNVGAYAEPMAEHITGMVLALAKRLFINHKRLMEGEFDQKTSNRMMNGLVCGILGYGGIGRATARIMRCLGMKIHALNSSGKSSDDLDFVGDLSDMERVLRSSDVILVSLPLNRFTRNLIGPREFSWMKPDAILINAARGGVIVESALYEHLTSHPEFMAGIDAWWIEPASHGEFRVNYPFFELPNFLGSPHNSPVVPGTILRATRYGAENILRYLNGEQPRGLMKPEDYE